MAAQVFLLLRLSTFTVVNQDMKKDFLENNMQSMLKTLKMLTTSFTVNLPELSASSEE